MMRVCVLIALAALAGGCGGAGRGAAWTTWPGDHPGANLVLGTCPDHAWLAPRIDGRSDWPAVAGGYRVDEVTYYDTVDYDRESYYNRFGGTNRSRVMIQTGVWLR